ncbi:MAG: hypothetical protein WCQ60_01645 [bacterium]
MKNNLLITGIAAVVFFSAAGYTTYAAVVVPPQSVPGAMSTQNKQVLEKLFTTRIAQFQVFASSTPASMIDADRKLLTTQIDTSIVNMNVAIDLLKGKDRPALLLSAYPGYYLNASNTPSLVKIVSLDTTLLAIKISLLTRVFRPNISANHSEAQQLLRTKNITSLFSIPGFASASSTVSTELVHQIVGASSMKEIQHLQTQLQSANLKNNISKTKNISSKKIIASSTSDVELEVATSTDKELVATSTPMVLPVVVPIVATTTDENSLATSSVDDASSTPQ